MKDLLKIAIGTMLTAVITLEPALTPKEDEPSSWMSKYEWVQYNVHPGTPLVFQNETDKPVAVYLLASDVEKFRVESAVIDPDMPLKKNEPATQRT